MAANAAAIAVEEGSTDAELELLRLENDTLRRKLAGLEESLTNVEQRYASSLASNFDAMDEKMKRDDHAAVIASGGSHASRSRAGHGGGSDADFEPSLENLRGLLHQIEAAKSEAMQFHEIGKEQLADDVQHLYRLLKRTRAERAQMAFRVEDLEMQLAIEKRRSAELAITVEAGEKAFLQVNQRDRDLAEKRIRKAEEKAHRREAEIEVLFNWVSERQRCLVTTADALTSRIKSAEADSQRVAETAVSDAMAQVEELRSDLEAIAARP